MVHKRSERAVQKTITKVIGRVHERRRLAGATTEQEKHGLPICWRGKKSITGETDAGEYSLLKKEAKRGIMI